jgi:arylsulfatase A-like enzyme
VISRPNRRKHEDIHTPTSCIDLVPTLLQVSGQAIPDWCEGQILPTFHGQNTSTGRSIFSVEAKTNPRHGPLNKGTIAMVKDQYKLIHYFGYDGHESEYELYDLLSDPEEIEDLYPSGGSIAAALQSELQEKLRKVNEPTNV